MNNIGQHIAQFIGLVLLQVLILNNIHLSGYINPYIYILYIMLLPTSYSRTTVLLNAFVIGITIDMFQSTGGLHAAATVFLAYFRPAILRLISTQGGSEFEKADMKSIGLGSFITYTVIAVLTHHFILFFIEAFRFSELFPTLLRALASTVFSVLIILILQFLTNRSR